MYFIPRYTTKNISKKENDTHRNKQLCLSRNNTSYQENVESNFYQLTYLGKQLRSNKKSFFDFQFHFYEKFIFINEFYSC
jgi:hypothetical protein